MLDLQISWSGHDQPLHLDDGVHTVGRGSDNDVRILAGRVSKRHAVVRIDGEQLFVRDLGSTNGTEIGGKAVGDAEVEVPFGAVVSFAGAMMRWAAAPSTMSTSPSTTTHLSNEAEVSTLFRYNMREGYSGKARDRIMEMSSGLFELLASDSSADEVGSAACEFVARVVTSDRVVMLKDQGEATSIEPTSRWTRQQQDENIPLRLSSTIVGEVLRERDSVLVSNPMEDPNYTGQESIMALSLRSAMAAPLFDNERVHGILYVDTADPGVRYDKDDLQVLTATANAVAVKLRNLTLENEMRTAARIQRSMRPRELEPPEGFELEAYQMMCHAVGGDLYHCAPRGNGRTLIALGDVSGKGMPAALGMGAATVLIGMLAEIDKDMKTLTQHLHRQLYRSLGPDQFITLFVGEIDPATGHISYVNAGHEPPLLVRANGELDALDSTGLPIALVDDLMCESAEATLEPGDLLAIFSDGIPEATTNGESFLGLDPVKDIVTKYHTEPLQSIRKRLMSVVKDFLKGDPMSDDVTLMLMRRKAL